MPPTLAEWVLDMVEEGRFLDPGEAVFVFMDLVKDIEAYEDLCQHIHKEILTRRLKEAENGKFVTWEEVKKSVEETLKNKTKPVVWEKIPLDE